MVQHQKQQQQHMSSALGINPLVSIHQFSAVVLDLLFSLFYLPVGASRQSIVPWGKRQPLHYGPPYLTKMTSKPSPRAMLFGLVEHYSAQTEYNPLLSQTLNTDELHNMFWTSLDHDIQLISRRSQDLNDHEINLVQKGLHMLHSEGKLVPAANLYIELILGVGPVSTGVVSGRIMIFHCTYASHLWSHLLTSITTRPRRGLRNSARRGWSGRSQYQSISKEEERSRRIRGTIACLPRRQEIISCSSPEIHRCNSSCKIPARHD